MYSELKQCFSRKLFFKYLENIQSLIGTNNLDICEVVCIPTQRSNIKLVHFIYYQNAFSTAMCLESMADYNLNIEPVHYMIHVGFSVS